MSTRQQTKLDFIKYLQDNPEQRFWQAVCNFSGAKFVVVSDTPPDLGHQQDTFYWEGKGPNHAT